MTPAHDEDTSPFTRSRLAGHLLVEALIAQGVDTVFGVPGESYLAVLDGFHEHRERIRFIACRQEGGAAFMAEAQGKLTGRPGICFVTRGPGATNASIGLHTAFQDSTPMILFIGQVASDQRDREAFQEVDYRQMFGPGTLGMAKWVGEVQDPRRLPEYIGRAFHTAMQGRPGPVVLVLPEDMLTQATDAPVLPRVEPARPAPDPAALVRLREMLMAAERPLVIAGGPGWTTQACTDLQRFAEAILAARDELALLETLDMGKPIQYATRMDVPAAARCIQWYAEAVDKLYDEVAPTGPEALALVTREPMGVIGAIVPWNYPMVMAAWKLGPALAAGNSVVLKPSEKSPLTALRLAELAVQAGLPPGVFNVVPGFGHEAGEALALHGDVDAIGFTGSTRIGRRMLEYAGRSNLKRVYNELGGKSAVLVFDDFADLPRAAKTVAGSMFFNQGESCNAPSRVLVHERVADEFVRLVAEQAPRHRPGNPLDPATVMGAIVDRTQMDMVMGYIQAGRDEGAHCVTGGVPAREDSGGHYVEPTVFDRVEPRMKIAREEIFGPVMSVLRFSDEAQAVALANDSPYGLAASVWSDNIHRAHRVARRLRAGTVHVNQYDEDDITVPFGGYKQSGNGRDKSLHAFDKVTELKTTWIRIDPA